MRKSPRTAGALLIRERALHKDVPARLGASRLSQEWCKHAMAPNTIKRTWQQANMQDGLPLWLEICEVARALRDSRRKLLANCLASQHYNEQPGHTPGHTPGCARVSATKTAAAQNVSSVAVQAERKHEFRRCYGTGFTFLSMPDRAHCALQAAAVRHNTPEHAQRPTICGTWVFAQLLPKGLAFLTCES